MSFGIHSRIADVGMGYNEIKAIEVRELGRAAAGEAAELSGRVNDWTLGGGWVWLAGRVIYLPVYAAGIPWVRTIVWIVATLVGLALDPV